MPRATTNHPLLSTVLLSWNRVDLLRTTVDSYLRTVSIPYELIIVDNNSSDGSRDFIRSVCAGRGNHAALLLDRNLGGDALNLGLAQATGEFLHISANDMEYLPEWDTPLLEKFRCFPELGQLSLLSPFHDIEHGEIWVDKPALRETRNGATIYIALGNIGDTSIIRREIWDRGVRWQSSGIGRFKFPADGLFSNDVKRLGYTVAWNDRYVVLNWGHNVAEFEKRLAYYLENAAGKQDLGIDGLRAQLKEHGYVLRDQPSSAAQIVQVKQFFDSAAYRRRRDWQEWMEWLLVVREQLRQLFPSGSCYLFVDDNLFGEDLVPGCRSRPFLERHGEAWGAPEDDQTAIAELQRMRGEGAAFIVFVWPAFWWLDYYTEFVTYLDASARRLASDDRVVVFKLHP